MTIQVCERYRRRSCPTPRHGQPNPQAKCHPDPSQQRMSHTAILAASPLYVTPANIRFFGGLDNLPPVFRGPRSQRVPENPARTLLLIGPFNCSHCSVPPAVQAARRRPDSGLGQTHPSMVPLPARVPLSSILERPLGGRDRPFKPRAPRLERALRGLSYSRSSMSAKYRLRNADRRSIISLPREFGCGCRSRCNSTACQVCPTRADELGS